jgi:hypothetical protein
MIRFIRNLFYRPKLTDIPLEQRLIVAHLYSQRF